MMNQSISYGCLLLLCVSLFGCESVRQIELQKVAKDWSSTIRASQVIPVYPLTEDIKPGDIYLVTTPVAKQHEEYSKRGYLRMENHIDSLYPKVYGLDYQLRKNYQGTFYKGYGKDVKDKDGKVIKTADASKNEHLFIQSALRPVGIESAREPWEAMPSAAFPSYTVEVGGGVGLSASFPISSIPVGVSLLGGGRAFASVTMKDAKTYGLPIIVMDRMVTQWADDHAHFLKAYHSDESPLYIRTIHRVYLIQRIAVGITTSSNFTGSGSGGAKKPVELLIPDRKDHQVNDDGTKKETAGTTLGETLVKNKNALDRMISSIQESMPGGTIKVTGFTDRSISMVEEFDRPLVVGFLAYDRKILKDGKLGNPIPTLVVLEDQVVPQVDTITYPYVNDYNQFGHMLNTFAMKKEGLFTQAYVKRLISNLDSGLIPYYMAYETDEDGSGNKEKLSDLDKVSASDFSNLITDYINEKVPAKSQLNYRRKVIEFIKMYDMKW